MHWETLRRRAWKTRSIAEHLNRAADAGGLPKVLSVVDLTFLGFGSIVGAGVYVLSGVTAHSVAGPSVILSYIVAATAALLAALSYAEFAVELPVAGGAFNYVSVTFGELAAWSVAWNMILETTLSSSAVARGFSGYLATLIGLPPASLLVDAGPVHLDFAVLVLIGALTLVLCRGVAASAKFNIGVCLLNVACIAFVLVAGLPRAEPANLTPFFPYGSRGMFAGSSIVFFAFVGFDYLANAAEEAANPSRDLPISIVGSLGMATVLYVLMSTTIVLMVPYLQVDVHAPFSAAFAARGMPIASKIVSFGALAGIITSTMTGLLSQARLFVVLGRERLLPARLAAVHPTTNTPVQATVLTGLCAGALALVLDINVLAELVSVGTLYVFYSVCAGVIFRRFYFPSPGSSPKRVLVKIAAVTVTAMGTSLTYTYEAPWPVLAACAGCWLLATVALCTQKIMRQPARFSMPLFPITPSLGILFTIHLLCSLGWPAYVRFAVWMVLGAVVYALYGAGAADQHEAETRRQRKETGDVAARQNGGAEMQLVERNLSTLEPERPLGMAVGEESWLLQGKNGS